MESLKKKINNMPLRHFFVLTVFITVFSVVVLSGLTIWTCMSIRHYLLPDSNMVYMSVQQTFPDGTIVESMQILNMEEEINAFPFTVDAGTDINAQSKFTIHKIESSYDNLTPKRKVLYQIFGIAMIVVPVMLSIIGILVCGLFFYKKKLANPIKILSDATEQIAIQNLDFSLQYDNDDEMGNLCHSFEQMRSALYDSNKQMCTMLEERKLIQASIAHDLRNPIAVIEGYTEYLQLNLSTGKLSQDRVSRIINNLNLSAKRLEHYTESVRTLNQMEDMEITPAEVNSKDFVDEMKDDLEIIALKSNISLNVRNTMPICKLNVDTSIVYRVIENIFSNAVRFATSEVSLIFQLNENDMSITVTDDGEGFSEQIIQKKHQLFLTTQQKDGHLGMGLAVSRILCKRHGGSLEISNNERHNAVVKIILRV